MKTREELIEWMRDAHAMERGLELTLKAQADNEELEPSLRVHFARHLAETTAHGDAVEACLRQMGAEPSIVKTGLGAVMTMAQGVASAFARDDLVKDLLTCYSSEHLEIACYEALREGAEVLGQTRVVELCDAIIPEEEAMAEWLRQNIPAVVRAYLAGAAE